MRLCPLRMRCAVEVVRPAISLRYHGGKLAVCREAVEQHHRDAERVEIGRRLDLACEDRHVDERRYVARHQSVERLGLHLRVRLRLRHQQHPRLAPSRLLARPRSPRPPRGWSTTGPPQSRWGRLQGSERRWARWPCCSRASAPRRTPRSRVVAEILIASLWLRTRLTVACEQPASRADVGHRHAASGGIERHASVLVSDWLGRVSALFLRSFRSKLNKRALQLITLAAAHRSPSTRSTRRIPRRHACACPLDRLLVIRIGSVPETVIFMVLDRTPAARTSRFVSQKGKMCFIDFKAGHRQAQRT